MKDIQTLRLYARVARLGSFSAAARENGLAQSQVSRMIAELEAGLGARLLSRTTRSVAPTEAGWEFLGRIEPILAAVDDAQNSVRESGELRGLLRIAMPSVMGLRLVIPRLPAFTSRHPQLHIDLVLDDRWQDMVREAVDVGLRVGALPEAAGTAKRIGTVRRVVVGAPNYLADQGVPDTPQDLTRHRIVGGPAAASPASWQFQRGDQTLRVDVKPHITINDTAGAVEAAVAGLGLTPSTYWACRAELQSGALVQVLADWEMPQAPVHAYFPLGRSTRRAARVFVDFVANQFEAL